MGDLPKQLKGETTIVSDLKALSSVVNTRKTKIFVYGFMFAFIACTAFLAFNPSANSSPWFNNLFTFSSSSSSSLFSYIFPNSSLASTVGGGVPVNDGMKEANLVGNRTGSGNESGRSAKGGVLRQSKQGSGVLGMNQTEKEENSGGIRVPAKDWGKEGAGNKKGGVLQGKNQTGSGAPAVNQTNNGVPQKNHITNGSGSDKGDVLEGKSQIGSVVLAKVGSGSGVPGNNGRIEDSGSKKNGTLTMKAQSGSGVSAKNGTGSRVPALKQTGSSTNAKEETKVGSQANVALFKSETAPKKSKAPVISEKKANSGAAPAMNLTASLKKRNSSSGSSSNGNAERKEDDWIKSMIRCDIFHGRWVKDESYPLYAEGSCPHIDEPFNCYLNGRADRAYQKLRWQPSGCNIPRLNATDMLERLRGKRLVFVGDSLNRNMWESLVCVLRNSVKDKKKVFEMSGKREFRTEGSYSFLFKDYGCTIEFFRSPFLVQEWEMPDNSGHKKETLRLDIIERSSSRYKDAHVIIFNTGHWWTHEKTSKGKDYYQEGSHVYGELNVVDAFHKALNTWARWVDANVNPKKTLVFFRGYSASHFSGGQWNSGGACDREMEPIKNETYLSPYPPKMSVLETVLEGMKIPVSYLNITRMTDYRKDAHPSIYRKPNLTEEERRAPERYQDCSHWCLPGVPDSWNEILYAQLLIKQYQQQH